MIGYNFFHLNLGFSSIEEDQRPEVIKKCYWPILELADKKNIPIGIEATGYTLEVIEKIDPNWIHKLQNLIKGKKVEFIGSGYCQIIGPLVPYQIVQKNLEMGNITYNEILCFKPDIALINEQAFAPGLIETYKKNGFKSLIMDWADPFSHNQDWPHDFQNKPQSLSDQKGETINLIWSDAITFQQFQRYAHAETDLDDFYKYLDDLNLNKNSALCLYGSDAETFDFRAKRYSTEQNLGSQTEWERINKFFEFVKEKGNIKLAFPSNSLELMDKNLSPLILETPFCPIPVKKQRKYNIGRWAVTGRADIFINSYCQKLFNRISNSKSLSSNENWKKLCYFWSSDFRTHITAKRWAEFTRSILEFGDQIKLQTNTESITQKYSQDNSEFKVIENNKTLFIEGKNIALSLNLSKGMSIISLSKNSKTSSWLGTIPHGFFKSIEWGADFYSGHLTLDIPGQHKVTDLAPTIPKIYEELETRNLVIISKIDTQLGEIEKKITVIKDQAKISITYILPTSFFNIGSLRIGNVTLNPDIFDQKSLFFKCHNGGKEADTFVLKGQNINHGNPVSSLVSSSFGLGMSENHLEIGDKDHTIKISTQKSLLKPLGLIHFQNIKNQYFYRSSLSLGETDDTLRNEGLKEVYNNFPLDISFDIELI